MALAIAVACLASLYQIYTLGWRGMRLASLDRAAIEVARSQLASAGVETPLEEGTASGVSEDGIAWASQIQRYVPPDGPDADFSDGRDTLQAFWVRVKATWREGPARQERSLELETLKLKRAQQ